MSIQQIEKGLLKKLGDHRIVFWYDKERKLRNAFEEVQLPEVQKVELKNNEFAIKHRILREEPEKQFLLYQEGEPPADIENWLLDVLLAYGEFKTDQISIWLGELGLGLEFADVVREHQDFFGSKARMESLRTLLKTDDTAGAVKLKMLAVCADSEARLDAIVESLLDDLSADRKERMKLIERCELAELLWSNLKRFYGYQSAKPGIRDFALELFKSCYAMCTDGDVALSSDALVLLKRWKDNRQHETAFRKLSEGFAKLLNIEENLQSRDYRQLVDVDFFENIDKAILRALVKSVNDKTITPGDCAVIVKRRRQTHWYSQFQDLYLAIDFASQFIHQLSGSKFSIGSLQEGVETYARLWFKIDQLYRKFVCHMQRSGEMTLLQTLAETVENLYSNHYLPKINESWQEQVDKSDKWDIPGTVHQRHFFEQFIRPFLVKNNKVFVIISDALRYEVAEELLSRIRQENRFEAIIQPAVSMLPSYTQLGMAALLPNRALMVAEDDTGIAYVDGLSSMGTENRTKILAKASAERAKAIRADELLTLNRDECRDLIKDNDVVYVYHNRIDMVGDKRDTEERVFAAAEEAIDEIIKILKKLTNANANNLIITADHGFIYQHRELDESDYLVAKANGELLYQDRRFVIGTGLTTNAAFKKFSSAQLGLEGQVEIQLPKSTNRMRLKGSGSRFVHGGASLQEVVIPIVHVNKKRQSDISFVDVEIFRGAAQIITSNQIAVVLYQKDPVDDKLQPRTLRAGIYTKDDVLISDLHEQTFDLSSDNPREREFPVQFILTRQADSVNNQEVSLILHEQVPDTNHYREYKSIKYMVRRAFTSDFDF